MSQIIPNERKQEIINKIHEGMSVRLDLRKIITTIPILTGYKLFFLPQHSYGYALSEENSFYLS